MHSDGPCRTHTNHQAMQHWRIRRSGPADEQADLGPAGSSQRPVKRPSVANSHGVHSHEVGG